MRQIEVEESTRFANLALGLDAAFCNIVGLIFTLTGAFMSDWLGVAGWIATVFGILVLLWSFVVTLFANRKVSRRREVDLVVRVNLLTIAIAVVVIVIPGAMTAAGKVLVAIGAGIVLAFTLAQLLARRSLTH